jgi:hypothetical protein
VPAFTGEGITPLIEGGEIDIPTTAGATTWNDEAYGNVIKQRLGKRLLKEETDPNGYKIITYKGDDGKEYVAYVNKPGLDMSDVNRELAYFIPQVLGGFAISAVTGGMGLPARLLGAGIGETAVVGAQEFLGQIGGSNEPYINSITQAIAGGAGGVGGELLSKPVAQFFKWLLKAKAVDTAGKLTGRAAEKARELGLDPEQMNEQLSKIFARDVEINPEAAARKAGAGEFDIPISRAQMTQDPVDLSIEKSARQGGYGPGARAEVGKFDVNQQSSIAKAAEDKIGQSIAPNSAVGNEPAALGESIQTSVRGAKKLADDTHSQLWGELGPMYPDIMNRQTTLTDMLNRKLNTPTNPVVIRPEITPHSSEMIKTLEDYVSGKPPKQTSPLLNQPDDYDLNEMRLILKGMMDGAPYGSADKRAAARVYGAFNDWIDELAETGAMNGDVEMAGRLKTARSFTKDVNELFAPTKKGELTAGGARIENILQGDSAEAVIDNIFGKGSNFRSAPPDGSIQAVMHLRGILKKAGGDAGKEAWENLKLAYWMKIAQNRGTGEILPADKIYQNLSAAMRNQPTVIGALFNKNEQALLKRFMTALETSTKKEGYRAVIPGKGGGASDMVSNTINKLSWRAWWKGDWTQAIMLRSFAKHVPNAMGLEEWAGRRAAKTILSDRIKPPPGPPFSSALGTSGTLQWLDEENDQRTLMGIP